MCGFRTWSAECRQSSRSAPKLGRVAVWSPDGSYLVFGNGQFKQSFFRKPANSAAAEEFLLQVGGNATPLDISPDGKLLVYSDTGENTKDDLWLLPLQGEHKPVKYLDTPFEERQAQFSPDGKWMAYSSDESGQVQVYVQPVPATGAKRQISTQGGSGPRWRRDGKELYYISADAQLTAVPVKFGAGTFDVGRSPATVRAIPLPPLVFPPLTLTAASSTNLRRTGRSFWHWSPLRAQRAAAACHDLDELDGRVEQVEPKDERFRSAADPFLHRARGSRFGISRDKSRRVDLSSPGPPQVATSPYRLSLIDQRVAVAVHPRANSVGCNADAGLRRSFAMLAEFPYE